MTRITPRTCLWPLAGSLSLTFALSIGLTFRSNTHCFAATCGEWLFPLQARLHVVVWYCWLSLSVTFLAVRAFHPTMRKHLRKPLTTNVLPIIGKHLALSGVLVALWIISLYGIIVGIWWIRLNQYFEGRGRHGGIASGNTKLAAIALTGHMADVTMGMALIPISRHSALASFFKLSVSTTLAFHMITAYTLFGLVVTHGLLYVSWVPVFHGLTTTLRRVYPVLNPTYLYSETWPGNSSSLGVWRASLIFSGTGTALIFLLILITTLPVIRSRHFNVFYFTHLLGIVAVVLICLHASTMFYCTAPGLMMWLLDWGMRLYELRTPLAGRINALGRGWYCVTLPLPRRRLDGCACTSPLAHFYIHHSDSSIRELHPFTTTTHLASQNRITPLSKDDIMIQFLFRKRGAANPPSIPKPGLIPKVMRTIRKISRQKQASQWTDRVACLADTGLGSKGDSRSTVLEASTTQVTTKSKSSSHDTPISLRLEGPYFTTADPNRYKTVVCFVAGTGVSGAMAVAAAFKEVERRASTVLYPNSQYLPSVIDSQDHGSSRNSFSMPEQLSQARIWERCIVIWSVRDDDYIELPEFESSPSSSLEVQIHRTGGGRSRMVPGDVLDEIMGAEQGKQSIWVYISGPNAFIAAGEEACKERQSRGVEYYGARWDI